LAKENGGEQQPSQGGTQGEPGGPQGEPGGGPFHPLYASAIHNCIAQGELPAMKRLLTEAEAHLKEHGDVSAAVESLRLEITKQEYK
jgi:hypothetical protein